MKNNAKIGVLLGMLAFAMLTSTPVLASSPRIVSLDSCADQIVLRLADDEQILALSANSQLAFSYYKDRAAGFPLHGGSAEEILGLNPDVALSTGVGDFSLARMLGRLGMNTIATGLPDNLDGVVGDIEVFGEALGQSARAGELIAEINVRRADAAAKAQNFSHLKALYLSPGGTTTGNGTFVGEVIAMSGLTNLMAESLPAWGQIDLEALVLNPPDIIVGSFFDARVGNADGWRFAKHPVVERMMADIIFIDVPSKFLACPQWMMLDAVELIQSRLLEEVINAETR